MSFPTYHLSSFSHSFIAINYHSDGIPTHSHDFIELVFVLKGKATHTTNGFSEEIRQNDYIFLDFNTEHSYRPITPDFMVVNIMFFPPFLNVNLVNYGNFNDFCNRFAADVLQIRPTENISNRVFHADEQLAACFNKLQSENQKKQSGYFEIMRQALCEIIILTLRRITIDKRVHPITEKIINEIQTRYAQPISLSTLCKEYNYSLSYVSQIFKVDTNMNFTAFLQITRIEKACLMLTHTDLPISEISVSVGYNDIKTFNLLFKKLTGFSPSKYRKIAKT